LRSGSPSFVRFYTPAPPQPSSPPPSPTNTHYKITLRRSPISLGAAIKATLASLGIHRRMQTVYFPQWSVVAGKIFKVKELVEAENVSAHMVRTRGENVDRHGYRMTGSKMLDYVCKRCSVVTLLSLKLIERGFIRNAYLNMSVVILHSSHYFILQVFAVLKAFLTRS